MLHDHPELRPILLHFQLGEGGQHVGNRIVLQGLHQLGLPGGISFAVELVGLAIKFVDLKLGNQDILQIICEGRGGHDCVRDASRWSLCWLKDDGGIYDDVWCSGIGWQQQGG